MARDAAAYADLLAGFRAFTLHRCVDGPEAILELAVYQAGDPGRGRPVAAASGRASLGEACLCIGSAVISLEGSAVPAGLSIHHGDAARWQGAMRGDLVLSEGASSLNGWPSAEWRRYATIRREIQAYPLPARTPGGLVRSCSAMRKSGGVERRCAARMRPDHPCQFPV